MGSPARKAYTRGMQRVLGFVAAFVLVEILLLVRVWGQSGILGLLLLVVGSAAAGLLVVRTYGPRALATWTSPASAERQDGPVWQARLGLLAGLLLIIPGVLTDLAALLLLLPPVRSLVASKLRGKAAGVLGGSGLPTSVVASWAARFGVGTRPPRNGNGQVIDLETKPDDRPKRGN